MPVWKRGKNLRHQIVTKYDASSARRTNHKPQIPTPSDFAPAVFDYIETFYNPKRRHSSIGQISPMAFENQQKLNNTKAA
jgi:transposase InsO family protein